MWVQLLTAKTIDIRGEFRRFNAGDWVDVGKQTALLWLSEGTAHLPDIAEMGLNLDGVGIITDHKEMLCSRLKEELRSFHIEEGQPGVPYDRTIYMDSLLKLRTGLLPVGLSMLDTWEIAVPLMDYKTLALLLGTPDEREKTKTVIRDLRVLAYDTRLMFIRKTEGTIELMAKYRRDGKTPLAFLRALYEVKPFIMALPTTWLSAPHE